MNNPIKDLIRKTRYPPFPYQRYNIKYKCIFIHIPRSAGTSILKVLGATGGRIHCRYLNYLMSDSEKFRKYFKFSFVRNPWDRVVSTYRYLKGGGNQSSNDDIYYQSLIKTNYPTLEQFVLNYLDHQVLHEHLLFKPQFPFIYDHQYRLKVDYLGRYENIEEDFKQIAQHIGLTYQVLPNINSSRVESDVDMKSEDVTEKIAKLYSKDIELFHYSCS